MTDDREYTPRQRKIIGDYYKTASPRAVANLQKLAGELYLATTERKRKQLWRRARKSLEAIGMKQSMIDHIISTGKPEILAAHLKDLF